MPAIAANTFEIKSGTIQMVQNSVQFGGSPTEDPNMHIRDFIEICDTFKFNGVTEDAIKLRLFPFSLRDKSKGCLHSLPAGSITTWDDLAQKFLTKFFPMAKTAAIRNAITQFSQQSGETLCEAWERYKEMLGKCPHHEMPDWMNPTQRLHQGKAARILDVDATTALTAQLKALTMKVNSLANLGNQQPPSVCEICAGAHSSYQCAISSESAQFVSNFQRSQQPTPATYLPNNRNHPNFSWSNNQNFMPQQQQQFQQQGARPFNPFGFPQQFAPKQQFHPPGFQQQNHGIGQIANALINRPQRTLPSDTEANLGKKEMKEQSDSGKTVVEADKNVINEEASKESAKKSSPKADIGVKQVYPPPPFPKRL
ncbi:uncharacterized protein LOC135151588 [Daucus carota subsp. sativus]|uniref:uncharacterized protein LOC135151588 n=1 Tax=Daucus carota subsp. sativus TaxID=79200 RepID=UPI003082B328